MRKYGFLGLCALSAHGSERVQVFPPSKIMVQLGLLVSFTRHHDSGNKFSLYKTFLVIFTPEKLILLLKVHKNLSKVQYFLPFLVYNREVFSETELTMRTQ